MFAPCKTPPGFVNVRALKHMGRDHKTGAPVAITSDETILEMDMDPDLIQAMACTVIPATETGFLLLVADLNTKEVDAHPVIGWRIRTPHMPEPITPYWDIMPDWDHLMAAVQYPDGRVVIPEVVFPDRTAWMELVQEARLQWLKEKGPDDPALR